jgi:hypothetical protein
MAKKGFTLDDAIFQKKIRDLAKRVGVDEKDFVREQGALLLRDIAKIVPPYKVYSLKGANVAPNKMADYEAGVTSIRKDLATNFRVRDQSYIEHIFDVTGKTANIRQVLRNKKGKQYVVDIDYLNLGNFGEALRFHRSRQSKVTGRAFQRRKGGKDTKIGRWKDRNVMWVNQDIYNQLHDYLIKDLGKGKASVSKAMLKLNPKQGRNVPKWVKRQLNKVMGNARMAKIGGGWSAIFRASADALYHVKDNNLTFIKVARLKAMERRLKFLLRDNAKKAGLKVR